MPSENKGKTSDMHRMLQRLPQLSDTRARRFRTSRLLEEKKPVEDTAEPILLVKLSKSSAPPKSDSPETTMEVTTGQIEVSEDDRFLDVKDDSLLAPIDIDDDEQTLEAEEPTTEAEEPTEKATPKRDSLLAPISLDDDEQTIPKVRAPGPPKLPSFDIDPDGENTTHELTLPPVAPPKRKKFTDERPEDEVLFSTGEEEDSVNQLLEFLQEYEEERVLDEEIEKEEAELNQKRRELLAVIVAAKEKKIAEEKAKKKEAAAKAEREAEEERKAAEREEAERKAAQEETVEEIEIDLALGIDWVDEHTTHKLTDDETIVCRQVLPERERLWILPVPEGNDEQERIILETCKDDQKVTLAGQEYYILQKPFAEAKSVARMGNVLNIWPESITTYEFLGNIGAEVREYREVEWERGFFIHRLTDRELDEVDLYLPENAPRLLHPVPDVNTKNPRNLEILGMCRDSSIITLGGNQYYIFNIHSMAVWKDIVTKLPKARITSREGNKLSIWDEVRNCRQVLEALEIPPEPENAGSIPPIPPKGMTVPHPEEIPHVEEIYVDGAKYLKHIPARIGDMDIDELNSIINTACTSFERSKGKAPFVSIRGKWYLAHVLPVKGAKETRYEDGVVISVIPKTPADGFRELRKKSQAAMKRVRRLDEVKVEFLKNFPEGEVRYMLEVPKEVQSDLPDIEMPDGNGASVRYLIHKEYVGGSIAVVRKGGELHKVSGNEPQSEL